MRIYSWNVNGLRSAATKGFLSWLSQSQAHIVGLQEVRARVEQLGADVRSPSGWHTHFSPADRPGYSGVGLYSRASPDRVETSLGDTRFDIEGRMQIAHFGKLKVANVYFPNGSGKDRDNSRISYKLAFYQRLFELLEPWKARGEPVLVLGDFNTAHQEIDLARPKENQETSGFCPIERAELSRWLNAGWIDTFREFHKDSGHYSWWSNRGGARERNVGWRIDYVMASPTAMKYVKGAFIHPHILGSDHCPVGVDLEPSIF